MVAWFTVPSAVSELRRWRAWWRSASSGRCCWRGTAVRSGSAPSVSGGCSPRSRRTWGGPSTSARLADLVWADDVPADPAGAVQTNVARLRRLLPGGIRLTTTSGRLPAGRGPRDRRRHGVRRPSRRGRGYSTTRGPTGPSRGGAGAVAGEPLPGAGPPALAPEVARLAELRAGAVQQHAEALLAAGRAAEAVAELEALVAAEPLREGAVGVLMRALVAAGRQGDALAAFARLRTRLADELGLDPSPQLRELERRVLRQELPVPRASPVAAGPTRPRAPARPARGCRSAPSSGRAADLARVVEHRAALPGGDAVRTGRGGQDAAGAARRRGGRRPLRRRRAGRRVRRGRSRRRRAAARRGAAAHGRPGRAERVGGRRHRRDALGAQPAGGARQLRARLRRGGRRWWRRSPPPHRVSTCC